MSDFLDIDQVLDDLEHINAEIKGAARADAELAQAREKAAAALSLEQIGPYDPDAPVTLFITRQGLEALKTAAREDS